MPEAYPEIIFGHQPWRHESTTQQLPRRLGELNELTAEYAAEVEGDGIYNLSFQLWLVDRVPPTPDAARAEVMVWISNHGMQPAGRRVRVAEEGFAYDVHVAERRHLDRGVWRTWRLITLIARNPLLTGPLDIDALLRELRDEELLATGLWVANVDLGTEIAGGAGSATISDYRVTVR